MNYWCSIKHSISFLRRRRHVSFRTIDVLIEKLALTAVRVAVTAYLFPYFWRYADRIRNPRFLNFLASTRPLGRSRRRESATAPDSSDISKAYAFVFLKNATRAILP
jgi:hypothetical protein